MNQLIANETAYQTLAATVRGGRLSHALLIEGPAGCGKTTFAREAAQAALCSAPREQRPCGECRHCRKVEKDIHPDLLTYQGEGGSRSFHVDTVRALRQEAFIRPNEADAKVILLRNAQDLSVQAQNALLKILEEPPGGVRFLLTCENRSLLLETIRSRVQVISLALPDAEACAAHLRTLRPEAAEEDLLRAARRAEGNVGRALALLEEGREAEADAVEILYNACIGDELEALTALSAYERDRQGLILLLNRMGAALSGEMLRPSQEGPLHRLALRAGPLRLMQILAIIEDTAHAVSQNVSGLLLVTGLCAKMRSALADG